MELCSAPRRGEPTNVMTRARRAVYVPREVQERQKLKVKSVQNGSVVLAHMLLASNPNLARIESEYLSKLEDADLLSSFLYFINFLASSFVEEDREGRLEDIHEPRPARRSSSSLRHALQDGQSQSAQGSTTQMGGAGSQMDTGDRRAREVSSAVISEIMASV